MQAGRAAVPTPPGSGRVGTRFDLAAKRQQIAAHLMTNAGRDQTLRTSLNLHSPSPQQMPSLPIPSIFDFFSCGYTAILPCPRIISSGMMYHKSSGIRYAATKSNGAPSYGPRHPRTVHEYPPRSLNIVDFTCTRTKCPSRSPAKSYRAVSPQGFETCNPFSAARTMKHSSAHSPRNFGCLIFAPAPCFAMSNCRYPLPNENEKRGPQRGRAASNTTLHPLSHQILRETIDILTIAASDDNRPILGNPPGPKTGGHGFSHANHTISKTGL